MFTNHKNPNIFLPYIDNLHHQNKIHNFRHSHCHNRWGIIYVNYIFSGSFIGSSYDNNKYKFEEEENSETGISFILEI